MTTKREAAGRWRIVFALLQKQIEKTVTIQIKNYLGESEKAMREAIRAIERLPKPVVLARTFTPLSAMARRRFTNGTWKTVSPKFVILTRKLYNENRVQFGRRVGVSTWTVFMWEHGRVRPGEINAAKLVELFKARPKK